MRSGPFDREIHHGLTDTDCPSIRVHYKLFKPSNDRPRKRLENNMGNAEDLAVEFASDQALVCSFQGC